MIYISTLLLSISSNIDTLSVSLSYGIKKIFFPKSSMLLLAIFTSISTFFSMYIGKLLLPLFGLKLANIFGAVLLAFLGISLIVEYIKLKEKNNGYDTSYFYESPLLYKNMLSNPIIIDADKSNHIDIKESLNLSIAISLNNFYTILAASLTGVNINLSVLVYFITSIIFICLGYNKSNTHVMQSLKDRLYLISGIILIVFGIYEAII